MSVEGASAKPDGSFRLGEWLVQPELNRIAGEERTLQIEPRVMEVLVYLAARAGRVVSRQELREAVWGSTVVTDQTMTRAIWELRNALDDDPSDPHIIETIRKGGYRLIAPVTYDEVEPTPSHPATDPEPGSPRNVWLFGRRIRILVPVLTGILLAVACAVAWYHLSSRRMT